MGGWSHLLPAREEWPGAMCTPMREGRRARCSTCGGHERHRGTVNQLPPASDGEASRASRAHVGSCSTAHKAPLHTRGGQTGRANWVGGTRLRGLVTVRMRMAPEHGRRGRTLRGFLVVGKAPSPCWAAAPGRRARRKSLRRKSTVISPGVGSYVLGGRTVATVSCIVRC